MLIKSIMQLFQADLFDCVVERLLKDWERCIQKSRRTSVSMKNELKDVTSEVQAKALAIEYQLRMN